MNTDREGRTASKGWIRVGNGEERRETIDERRQARPGLRYGELTQKVIGIFYQVYRELGHGFLESVYEAALDIALREAGLQAERQIPVAV